MFDTEGATIGALFVSTNVDIFIVTETFFKNKQYQNKDIIVACRQSTLPQITLTLVELCEDDATGVRILVRLESKIWVFSFTIAGRRNDSGIAPGSTKQ